VTALNTPGFAKRKIREAIRDTLKGRTSAGDRVFFSRAGSPDADDLPQILIRTASEQIEVFDHSPKRYRRNMEVVIECIAAGDDDEHLDQELENLAEQVETILESNERLGLDRMVNSLELTGSDYSAGDEGESPIGNIALRYNVQFFLYAITNQELPTLTKVGTEWKVGHDSASPDDVVDAEDETEL
jgi:hypothetical protein